MTQAAVSDPVISAIMAARAGRETDAAKILADLTKAPGRNDVPFGFVLGALRQIGATALAAWLHDRAIARGLDVTAPVPAFDTVLAAADPATARTICRRYERAFADGAINAGMVGRYAIALSRAGEWDTLAALYPAGKTVLQMQLDVVDGFDSLAHFNDCAVSEIRDHAEEELLDARNYMQGALRYHKVHEVARPAVSRLLGIAERAFDAFVANYPDRPDDPLRLMQPQSRDVVAWANIYDVGSFVRPHLHHEGWLVAVYYPRVPDLTGDAGALKVECPHHLGAMPGPDGASIWPALTIQPKPGLLVVMPAYCYHYSVPFAGQGQRVAVTIDRNIDQHARSLPFGC